MLNRVSLIFLSCCVCLLVPRLDAQGPGMQYNVSIYLDVSFSDDGSTLLGVSTTSDNSTGCDHSAYSTVSAITSPDNRSTTNTSGGMTSNSAIPINDAEGTYTFYGNVAFHCSCVNGQVGGGATPVQAPLEKIIAYYRCDQVKGVCTNNIFGVTTYRRCNSNNRCDTVFSKQTAPYGLLTVYRIMVALGYECQAFPQQTVVQSSCKSPDPKP